MSMKDETPFEPKQPVMEFKKLDPLPRVIRRSMLKAAIKAGKDPYEAGKEAGYEAAKKTMYEAGFREGYNTAVRESQQPAKDAAAIIGQLVQPVELGIVAPDGSKLVVSERETDYQPSEDSALDGGHVVVRERV